MLLLPIERTDLCIPDFSQYQRHGISKRAEDDAEDDSTCSQYGSLSDCQSNKVHIRRENRSRALSLINENKYCK